jgi:hypothetical protein
MGGQTLHLFTPSAVSANDSEKNNTDHRCRALRKGVIKKIVLGETLRRQ